MPRTCNNASRVSRQHALSPLIVCSNQHSTFQTGMQSVEWEKTYAQDLLSSNLTSVSSMPLTSEPGPVTLVASRPDLEPVLSPFAGFAARAEAAGDSDGTATPRHRRVSSLCC